jgi:transcriptional regulator NrdR family protein
MKCLNPNCNYFKTEICDSHKMKEDFLIKRRRCCYKCQTRYTTLEIPIYIGKVHMDARNTIKKISNYFAVANPYAQWQAILLSKNLILYKPFAKY